MKEYLPIDAGRPQHRDLAHTQREGAFPPTSRAYRRVENPRAIKTLSVTLQNHIYPMILLVNKNIHIQLQALPLHAPWAGSQVKS